MSAARQTAVFASFNAPDPCPIDAEGNPLPDPEAAWEDIRKRWRTPRPPPSEPSDSTKKEKDPVFVERLSNLERMLRHGEPAPATTSAEPQVRPPPAPLDEAEPDGGGVIREKANDDLKRASEGILLAFKQGRQLREALPLSLVTSLLYRSWEIDGTIPANYRPGPPSPPALTFETSLPPFAPSPSLSAPSSSTTAAATPSPVTVVPKLEQSETGEGIKMQVDMLKGSRWRTEKEVASGSDVI